MKTLISSLLFAMAANAAAVNAGEHDHHAGKPAATAAAQDNAADKEFVKLDSNHDGFVSKSELAAKHPLLPHFSMADQNKDGKLDRKEFAAGKAML